MTALSYALPKSAPRSFVWFAQCDVCFRVDLLPHTSAFSTCLAITRNGWRSRNENPMDTCPECLAKEAA